MNPEKLYDICRKCGEKYWLELSRDEHERWERIAKAVSDFCDVRYDMAWSDGYNSCNCYEY